MADRAWVVRRSKWYAAFWIVTRRCRWTLAASTFLPTASPANVHQSTFPRCYQSSGTFICKFLQKLLTSTFLLFINEKRFLLLTKLYFFFNQYQTFPLLRSPDDNNEDDECNKSLARRLLEKQPKTKVNFYFRQLTFSWQCCFFPVCNLECCLVCLQKPLARRHQSCLDWAPTDQVGKSAHTIIDYIPW